MEYKFKSEKLLITAWINNKFKKSIIIAPGLPQFFNKYNPLIRNLIKLEYNIFSPDYYGSWNSPGTFSLKNSIKSIKECIDYVKGKKGTELYNNKEISWECPKLIVLGNSYGALPALINNEFIDELILMHPFINYVIHEKGEGEDLAKTFEFLNKAYSETYKFKAENLINELREYDYERIKCGKKIKLILGMFDTVITKEEIEWLKNKFKPKEFIYDTEHTSDINVNMLKQVFIGKGMHS